MLVYVHLVQTLLTLESVLETLDDLAIIHIAKIVVGNGLCVEYAKSIAGIVYIGFGDTFRLLLYGRSIAA
jgi:hypothetical protein